MKQEVVFSPSTLQWQDENVEPCLLQLRPDCTLSTNKLHVPSLWIGTDDPVEEQRLQAEHNRKVQQIQDYQLGGSERHIGADDSRHALQENGGLADQRYTDDGDILCHPILVPSFLQAFDTVIHYLPNLDAAPPEWNVYDVCLLASVSTVACGSNTLRCHSRHE